MRHYPRRRHWIGGRGSPRAVGRNSAPQGNQSRGELASSPSESGSNTTLTRVLHVRQRVTPRSRGGPLGQSGRLRVGVQTRETGYPRFFTGGLHSISLVGRTTGRTPPGPAQTPIPPTPEPSHLDPAPGPKKASRDGALKFLWGPGESLSPFPNPFINHKSLPPTHFSTRRYS